LRRKRSERGANVAEVTAARELLLLFAKLRRRYDSGSWWPARTRFEMMAGAVLTQRTRWESACAALKRLRRSRLLNAARLLDAGPQRVAAAIRPCGNHQSKAARLLALAQFVVHRGGLPSLAQWPTDELREGLLSIQGIGPETADAILLYAFERPVFVADAYALRWLARIGWLKRAGFALRYGPVCQRVTDIFAGDREGLAALHAVIVEHGKALCGARPRCADCFLSHDCDTGRGLTASRRSSR